LICHLTTSRLTVNCQACQTADWPIHKLECLAVRQWDKSAREAGRGSTDGATIVPSDAIRALGRILWKLEASGSSSVIVILVRHLCYRLQLMFVLVQAREISHMQSRRFKLCTWKLSVAHIPLRSRVSVAQVFCPLDTDISRSISGEIHGTNGRSFGRCKMGCRVVCRTRRSLVQGIVFRSRAGSVLIKLGSSSPPTLSLLRTRLCPLLASASHLQRL
jgi:hypothetical protein